MEAMSCDLMMNDLINRMMHPTGDPYRHPDAPKRTFLEAWCDHLINPPANFYDTISKGHVDGDRHKLIDSWQTIADLIIIADEVLDEEVYS